MNIYLKRVFGIIIPISILVSSCTKLDEQLNASISSTTSSSANPADLLKATYLPLKTLLGGEANMWALQEHSSDESIAPTRGGDWDDNGKWRNLHRHEWTPENEIVVNSYNTIGKIVFNATDILKNNPPAAIAAQARFLRAFALFYWADGWGQISLREPNGAPTDIPTVKTGVEAINYIISELDAIINDLPEGTVANNMVANKNAARVLYMKAYLNKGVIVNPKTPTFAAADMNKVIEYGNAISGYSLQPKFFDNFTPNNNTTSTENIFVQENIAKSANAADGNNIRARWFAGSHYNMGVVGGWNGFTTLGDFYDKFEATDKRKFDTSYSFTKSTGFNVGFLIGQQYDSTKKALTDRKSNPLSFTKAVSAKETGSNLEVTGIRVWKYVPDISNGDNVDNDCVIYRYADVLLMLAEAKLRGGTTAITVPSAATEVALVNLVRTRAGVANLTAVTLDNILDERGRELYYEAHRRTDLRRFGKFLSAFQEKNYVSADKYLLFPIPSIQVGANPNLKQNPGY